MNALVHFVHWTIPLFLFLVNVPHGRDINHCCLPPFSYSVRPCVGRLTCTLEYLLSLRFYCLELRESYLCTSCSFFFLFCSPIFLFRSPAEISSNSLRYRAYSFSPPSLSDRRAPTGTSSISHLPRSRFANERLFRFLSVSLHFFRQFLSACLTTGRNHRFSYPPFLFCRTLRLSLVSYPYDGLPIYLGCFLSVHRCILRFF